MLAALVGVQIAAGLILRGAGDSAAQAPALLWLIGGVGAWLAGGTIRGRVPRPSSTAAAWAATLAALSLWSALSSLVPAYALPAWAASAAGLWLFPAATLLDADARVRVEQVVRVAGWLLVFLALYQRLHGDLRPAASFPNQNVFAGAVLLLLPFAARRGDPALAVGLVVCLWWTRSVGAWLGLSVALVLSRRAVGTAGFWVGAAAGFAGLVAAYAKLESPETLHRWAWWTAAARMSGDAPWLGLGPGAFSYALPSYVAAKPELYSLFAHQHLLETAAERGWPYLILWTAGLGALLFRARPSLRFGMIAALVHGLVDYPLSVPGVFWLFCLSAAWTLPESERALTVRVERKAPALAAIIVVAAACAVWVERGWRAARLRASAIERLATGAAPADAEPILAASETLRPHPEAARLRAEIALLRASAGDDPSRRLTEAAADLERSVAQDPYRASSWGLLEAVYRRLGRAAAATDARRRGALTCPSLRAGAA